MQTRLNSELSRRRLLGAGAALSGLTLAGCASMSSGPSIGRVVVVGGGFGGATAARYLKMWGGNVDVTLVERARVAARPSGGGASPRPARPTPVAAEPSGGPETVSRPPAPVAAGGTGTLRINTRPWSQVYVDGTLIGNTPQMNIPLRAGSHRVTLVNTEFNIRETITVNIAAGATETKVLTLNPG